MGLPMNETKLSNAVVIYQQEDGRQGIRPSGGFMPKKSWPIAFASEQGVTLLPGAKVQSEVLEDARALLGLNEAHTSEVDITELFAVLSAMPKGSVIAFDVSRKGAGTSKELLKLCPALINSDRDFDVVAFDDASVIRVDKETLTTRMTWQGYGASYEPIGAYVDQIASDAPAVVVISDGAGPHYHPAFPNKWTWVVPTSGQAWMSTTSPAMNVIRVTEAPAS